MLSDSSQDSPLIRNVGLDLNRCTMKEVYDKFGLEATTRDFIGHSMALYQTDEYINQKGAAKETVVRIRLYANSMARYGKSPYIYPLYGLGELPQGFARLSAIYGGTYMLNTNIDEIEYEGGKVSGIKATMRERSEDSDGMKFSTKTKKIIADPSYFPGKVQVVAHLLKAICILTHPVANTENSDSAQLIIPQSQVGRRNGRFCSKDLCPYTCLTSAQIYTSPSSLQPTMSAPKVITSPLSPRLPKAQVIITLSYNPALTDWERSRRSLWALQSLFTNPWRAGGMIISLSRRATTLQAISKLLQVSAPRFQMDICMLTILQTM